MFGARETAEARGFGLIGDNPIPGTSGLPSLHGLISEGHTVLTF